MRTIALLLLLHCASNWSSHCVEDMMVAMVDTDVVVVVAAVLVNNAVVLGIVEAAVAVLVDTAVDTHMVGVGKPAALHVGCCDSPLQAEAVPLAADCSIHHSSMV